MCGWANILGVAARDGYCRVEFLQARLIAVSQLQNRSTAVGEQYKKCIKPVNLNIKIMWVSILQNGRKKDKENSYDKINQFLKMTQKSTYSTSITRSNLLSLSRVTDDRRDNTKEKENQGVGSPRVGGKLKSNFSTGSILANRSNTLLSYTNNATQDADYPKRMLYKNIQEHSLTMIKNKRYQEGSEEENGGSMMGSGQNQKKSGYFLRFLNKKGKSKNQLQINIHNSIYTFKQFLKACQYAQPKSIDTRIPTQNQNRKTIVFDMDQTLIHTNENVTPNFQIKVPYRSFQGRVGYGFVEVRPFCKEILKRLSEHFDIIIFTASTQAYADPIIDHIDPDRVVIHRLYRQSCSFVKNQIFVKDLRVLGRKLSNVVLVDNAPYSYIMQLDNAIPILPYYRGKDDEQLISLQEYLMKLKDVEDVRPINKQYFRLHEYAKYDTHEKVIKNLYGEWVK